MLSNPQEFIKLLTVLGREGDTIRLAREGDGQPFSSSPIPWGNVAPAMEAIAQGRQNVWFELNQSLYTSSTGRSSAAHITRLSALYADIDFKEKPAGMGSLPEALEVVDDLSNALGYQPSAIVYSGHGIQPYWPIADGHITDDNRDEMATLLKRWGMLVKQFSIANHGNADSVFDFPRILRVPNTVNWKNPAAPATTSIEFFDGIDAIDVAWIGEVLDSYNIITAAQEISTGLESAMDGWEWADENCQFFATAQREIETSRPGARHQWALKWSGILHGMIRNGCLTEQGFYLLRDTLAETFKTLLANESNGVRQFSAIEFGGILKQGQRWAEGWSKAKLSDELRQHLHGDFAELTSQGTPPPVKAPSVKTIASVEAPVTIVSNVSSIFSRKPIAASPAGGTSGSLALAISAEAKSQQRLMLAAFTDTGNAERLALHLRGRYIWVPEIGWHEWKASRYVPDVDGHVNESTKDLFVTMLNQAPDDDARKWAHRSLARPVMTAAMELAKSIPHLVVNSLHLDAKPYEMNTPDGIYDLTTGERRTANPSTDFHTLQSGQVPERMPIPSFLAFLSWAMNEPLSPLGQPTPGGRIEYLQHLFGVAAIGELKFHVFPILLGVGSNGKTTLLDIMAGCFGQYAAVMPAKFLVEKKNESHPTDIAQLRGVRLAITSEAPPTARFDEELVKRLTGETRLTARYMHGNNFSFNNSATIFMAANHLPGVSLGGVSFWRRARKIDFELQVATADQNPNLVAQMLAAEGPGILQWALDGAAHVLKHGLATPDKVMIATTEYQLEEDTIARFMAEHLTELDGVQVSREHVYGVYEMWVRRQNMHPLSLVKFGREVTTIHPKAGLGSNTVFTNMTLIPQFPDFGEDR